MWMLSILMGILYAEFVGYWIHKLLHSELVPSLSRGHMEHHLREYGPKMPMRTSKYVLPTHAKHVGIGFEWLLPIGSVLGLSMTAFWALGLAWTHIFILLGTGVLWGVFMFAYMHDTLHIENIWLLRSPVARWFKNVRRLHDIHHLHLTDDGRMNKNYGICFFGMDKIFGTYQSRGEAFNEVGYNATKTTYNYIYTRRY